MEAVEKRNIFTLPEIEPRPSSPYPVVLPSYPDSYIKIRDRKNRGCDIFMNVIFV
jgi:hypothetical protein